MIGYADQMTHRELSGTPASQRRRNFRQLLRAFRGQPGRALGEIEHSSAVDGLIIALRDDDWQVRKHAAWALGEIEDPTAISALRTAANDSNSQVRRAVDDALGELGAKRRRQ